MSMSTISLDLSVLSLDLASDRHGHGPCLQPEHATSSLEHYWVSALCGEALGFRIASERCGADIRAVTLESQAGRRSDRAAAFQAVQPLDEVY